MFGNNQITSSANTSYSGDLFHLIFDMVLLTICVGFPIWRSYKVVEAKKFDNELIQWLTYWVLFSCLTRLEDYGVYYMSLFSYYIIDLHSQGRIIALLYKLIKLTMIAWMIHPNYQGALLLYSKYIEKPFRDHEENIRDSISYRLETSKSYLTQLCDKLIKLTVENQKSIVEASK